MFHFFILALSILVVFSLGFGIGYLYSRDSEKTSQERIRMFITVVVTVMWMIAISADIVITGYTVGPLIHAIMGAIVGYFFAEQGLDINIGG
jgi:hypothetical protein